MRNESDVNEHRRAFQQSRGSNGANIVLPNSLHPTESLWTRLKERYFKWETLTVAGKTIEKGWVVPQGLGVALIAAIISCTGILYWRIIDKAENSSKDTQSVRELVIRLDQRLIDKNEHDNQRFDQIERKQQDADANADAWRQVTNKEIAQLKAKRS